MIPSRIAIAFIILGLPTVVFADAVADLYESLYGDKAKAAAKTFDKKDDVALGAEILEAAKESTDEPTLAALLLRKSYEFSSKHLDGYAAAIEAMTALADLDEKHAKEAADAIILLQRRVYTRARSTKKIEAGEALMASLLKRAQQSEAASDWKQAGIFYRQAQTIATSIRSPERQSISETLKALNAKQLVASRIATLEKRFEESPSDSTTADQLVKLYVIELDQPERAAKAAAVGSDETAKRLVPATQLKPQDLKPEICLEMGDWYKKLADAAPKLSKGKLLNRSLLYYDQFLARTELKGLAKVKATLAIKDIHKQLATLGVEAGSTSTANTIRPGQAFDLVSVIQPKIHAIRGGWATKGAQMVNVEPAQFGLIQIPVTTSGSYDVTVEFTRKEGTTFMGIRLPVGNTSTAVIASWAPAMVGGLHSLDGMGVSTSPAKVPAPLINGKRNKIIIQVRVVSETTATIKAALNGKTLVNWKGPLTALASGKGFTDRNAPPSFAASSFMNNLIFHKISLRMIKGTARVMTAMDQHLGMIKANMLKNHFGGTAAFGKGTKSDRQDGWRVGAGNADLPAIMTNPTKVVQKIPGTMGPLSVAIHPGSTNGMGIAWRSPITGTIQIKGVISDAHASCGNGVNWLLHHLHKDGSTPLTTGEIETGKSAKLANETSAKTLQSIKVAKGDIIQLAIMPKGSYSCDLTRVDYQISQIGGSGKWNLAKDLTPDIAMKGKGNPHPDSLGNKAVWYFYQVPPASLPKP